MEYKEILYSVKNKVAKITLNRPERLNAWTVLLMEEFHDALNVAEADENVRVVLITGAGEKAFSAGFDLSLDDDIYGQKYADSNTAEHRSAMQGAINLALRIWDYPKPTVAAIPGYCLAVATEVIQMSDVIIASENAVFGEPEIRHHSGPAVFTTPWIIGIHKAKELLLTGDSVRAEEALALGMVNHVVPGDVLQDEAQRIAERLALVPPLAQRLNKIAINQIWEQRGLRHSLESAADIVAMIHGTATDQPEFHYLRKRQQEEGFGGFLDGRDGPFKENAARAYKAKK
jgi:enoyl-CoA hydratase/carnithine racemase